MPRAFTAFTAIVEPGSTFWSVTRVSVTVMRCVGCWSRGSAVAGIGTFGNTVGGVTVTTYEAIPFSGFAVQDTSTVRPAWRVTLKSRTRDGLDARSMSVATVVLLASVTNSWLIVSRMSCDW
jgi:hypothetical protein